MPEKSKFSKNKKFTPKVNHALQKNQKEGKKIIYDFPCVPQRYYAHFRGLQGYKCPKIKKIQKIKNQA